MAEMSLDPGHGQSRGSAAPALTLADEHLLLLWQVTTRTRDVLATTARGQWPSTELTALAEYAEAEVLRHASDEEALLFPGRPSQAVMGLARDHVRLRSGAELLARAAAGQQPLSPAQLAAVARDFVAQLERHMRVEERLLASERASRSVPATSVLGGRSHEWYPRTEGSVVDLDALPRRQAVAATVDRLLRMHRGEQLELQSSDDLNPVWLQMSGLIPDGYRFTVLQDGPPRWRMRVARRQESR